MIYKILIIMLTVNIIMDICKIKSNNKVIKELDRRDSVLKDVGKQLREDRRYHEESMKVRNVLNKKLDTVNRKLVILNKAKYKKY